MKRALALALAAWLTACHGPAPSSPVSPSAPTVSAPKGLRLVVLVVVDHFPEWTFEAKRPVLDHGFERLLREGEWRVGQHPSIATATAPGHALLGTGEPPARSGIIANTWWSRDEQRMVAAALGPDGSASARFLRVPGLGDALIDAHTGGKAVGVALKVRAARLPLGGHGLAVYYDGMSGEWHVDGSSTGAARPAATTAPVATTAKISPASTSTAPAAETVGASANAMPVTSHHKMHEGDHLSASTQPSPPWLAHYVADHPIAGALVPWTPLDPARLAELTGTVDAQPGEVGEKGFGPTFPHDPATTKHPTNALFAMPAGNDMTLDVATAAIAGEKLGTDDATDLLVISLSAHDYIAHGWGHESWEALDAELRLDARLDAFLTSLDTQVGAGHWAMIVTSDHGGSPLPERIGGGRIAEEQVLRAANAAATTVLGPGDWIASASWPYVFLTPAALAASKKDVTNVLKKITLALRSFPGLALVDRSDAYAGRCDERTGDAQRICLAIDPQRAGEILYMPARGWIIEDEDDRLATAHGSLNDYDRDVPVLLLPHGRKPHEPLTGPTGTLSLGDIAPLVRSWLGVR